MPATKAPHAWKHPHQPDPREESPQHYSPAGTPQQVADWHEAHAHWLAGKKDGILAASQSLLIRPGDTLLVRVSEAFGPYVEQTEAYARHLNDLLGPEVKVIVVAAEQLAIVRP